MTSKCPKTFLDHDYKPYDKGTARHGEVYIYKCYACKMNLNTFEKINEGDFIDMEEAREKAKKIHKARYRGNNRKRAQHANG